MEDFEIIEADFQQYYGLELNKVPFPRYCRLLFNLPPEARFICKYSPAKDWNWDRETASRVLNKLDVISCQLANMFKKKGTKANKPEEQFQPDYVKEAKKKALEEKNRRSAPTKNEVTEMETFWQARNPNIKMVETKRSQDV